MTDQLGRQLVEVKLPHSGKVALIVPYFTGGEREQIQDILFGDVSTGIGKEGLSLDGFQASQMLQANRKTLEIGVKHLDAPGVESPALATTEALQNLPEDDYDLLSSSLNETTRPKENPGRSKTP